VTLAGTVIGERASVGRRFSFGRMYGGREAGTNKSWRADAARKSRQAAVEREYLTYNNNRLVWHREGAHETNGGRALACFDSYAWQKAARVPGTVGHLGGISRGRRANAQGRQQPLTRPKYRVRRRPLIERFVDGRATTNGASLNRSLCEVRRTLGVGTSVIQMLHDGAKQDAQRSLEAP